MTAFPSLAARNMVFLFRRLGVQVGQFFLLHSQARVPCRACSQSDTTVQEKSLRKRMAGEALEPRKLIIDVDTGIDDAHAIMLALSCPSIEVLAITCANGNVKIDDVTANTLRVLQVCDRLDIPVYKGAARSLLGKVSEYENYPDRPAWHVPVDASVIGSEHAANALVRLTKQFPGEITLVALAPLTNIALAVNLDPEFPKRLRDVVIMGGNTDEFNFLVDPEAAHIVLGAMQNMRIVPLDTCCHLPWDFMEAWTGANNRKSNFIRDSLQFDIKTSNQAGRPGYRSADSCAMAAALDPTVATKEEKRYATVELAGALTRGQMVVDWMGVLGREHNASLLMGLDRVKLQMLLLSIVSSGQ